MSPRRLLFAAFICSGAAGLTYEVSWARLLMLSMGHTTAAAGTVVAAFMGGLALGAALGGRVATRLTPRAALFVYAGLELVVACSALGIGAELALLTPVLRLAYADGQAPDCGCMKYDDLSSPALAPERIEFARGELSIGWDTRRPAGPRSVRLSAPR